MAIHAIRTSVATLSILAQVSLASLVLGGCASADPGQATGLGESRAALEVSWSIDGASEVDTSGAELLLQAAPEDGERPFDYVDVGDLDQVVEAQGQDFPGKKCIRNDSEESSTSGACETVCKDRTVYAPHPSEDPAGTHGVCNAGKKA